MTTAVEPERTRERRRLNPFVFPSDTTFRFMLMVMSVIAAALFAYNWVYFAVSDRADEFRRSVGCLAASGPLILQTQDPNAYAARSRGFNDCLAGINHPKGYWILGGVAAMVLLAIVIYLLMPYWRLRRGRLVPLSSEDAPEVVEELERLVGQAGLREPPRFVWNPLNRSPTGLAFGRIGRHYVALSGGLVTVYYTDLDAFRAVVLHELGHLRNRDVDRTYFTMALWYAFVVAAVLPLLVTIADDGLDVIVRVAWRLAVLVVLVYLTRNAVLRSREVYADLRSDTSGGDAGIRRVILAAGGEPEPPVERNEELRRRIAGLRRLHPEPRERLAALDDTSGLFRPGVWEAFAAGLVLTLVFHELFTLVGFYVSDPYTGTWLAALLVAPFVASVVALGIWRATFRVVAVGGPGLWRQVVAVGLALGAGALAGEALAFENVVKSDAHPTGAMKLIGELVGFTPQKGVMSSDLFGPGVLWAVAEVAAMLLFVLWIAACAKLWLRRGGDRAPVAAAMAGLAAASALLTVWTGIFYLLYEVSAPAYRLLGGQLAGEAEKIAQTTWLGSERLYRVVMDPQAMDMYRRWPVLAALVLVWAFPLAAVVRVRGRPRAPRWTFLDRSEPPPVVPVRLQVGRALLVGAGGGLLAIVAVFALRAGLHAWGSEATRGTLEFASAFYYWEVVLVLIAQGLTAVVAASLCRSQRVLSALLAAFVAGIMGAAAILLSVPAGTCIHAFSVSPNPSPCAAWPTFFEVRFVGRQTLAEGAVVALVAAGAVALVLTIRSRARRPAATITR